MLVTLAPAKINWTLEVLGKRPDGYHEIASVMSTVSLFDELTLEPADGWRVTVEAPEPLKSELETPSNLVLRIIEELRVQLGDLADVVPTAHIHLVKRIPAASGLGGGSSDAAAMLRLLSKACNGRQAWRLTPPMLQETAARTGSDVSFFLNGGTAHVQGRGELIDGGWPVVGRWSVLLAPPLLLEHKTARLYSLLEPNDYTDGSRSRSVVQRFMQPGRPMIFEGDLFNVFERVASTAFPGLERYRAALSEATGAPAHLSGAGPSLFALAKDAHAAQTAAAALRADGYRAWAVDTIYGGRATGVRRVTHT